MIVIDDIYLGKLFISFYYFLGKQAQKSNILCVINAAEKYTSLLFFFTPEEMNDLSTKLFLIHLTGHEIFWRQYNWSREKAGILEESLRPGLTCTL